MSKRTPSHPEFDFEENRLRETVGYIRASVEETRHQRPEGGDDWATASLEQQQRTRLARLQQVLDQPYIGRIDFREEDHRDTEEFYIGYLNLDGPVRVIDWRAALASLFYAKNRVQVAYQAPGGIVRGELFLKRHLDIERRQLLKVMDELDRRPARAGVDITLAAQPEMLVDPDEYLRLVLEGRKGRELRDVVATIQERQNDLIRAKPDQILIIQGAAGSGKTTVALHRVAFLLYSPSGETRAAPPKMLIVGASGVFLEFIAQVLPRLGIKDIPQITFTDWALRLMGRQAPRQVSDATLTDILNHRIPREQRVTIYNRSRLKGSLKLIPLLEKLAEWHREQFDVPTEGLSYFPTGKGSLAIEYHVSSQAIRERLAQTNHLPVNQQRRRVISDVADLVIAQHQERYPAQVEALIRQINSRSGSHEQRQQWEELIEPYDDRRIPTQEEIQRRKIPDHDVSGMIDLAERKRRRALDNLRGEIRHLVTEDFNRRWPNAQAVSAYIRLVTEPKFLHQLSAGLLPWSEAQLLLHKGPPNEFRLRTEDLAPLVYLHLAFEGETHPQPKYDHIVVDEAQDLSPLQFRLLRQYAASGAMTILGDLAQSIHSYRGISRWQELDEVFADDHLQYEEISQTYRSTFEIMTFANRILLGPVLKDKHYRLSEPFQRHGPPVICAPAKDQAALVQMIQRQLQVFSERGYEHIAVICKSAAECAPIQRGLKGISQPLTVMLDADQKYPTGVVILPAHVTKGVEFEACIIANTSQDHFTATELDGRILYVSVTRALHELAVFWIGSPSPHLSL